MNFGFSDDELAIKRTAKEFLESRYKLELGPSSWRRTSVASRTPSGGSWPSSAGRVSSSARRTADSGSAPSSWS